jgi:ribokinase
VIRAVVVGSTNVDLVLPVPSLPRPGETVLGSGVRRLAGGKGGNQAVALARLGASVRFVSAVGDDADGTWSLAQLSAEGVDVSGVLRVAEPTGLAVVAVDPGGENSIVVAPGANAHVVAPADLDTDVLLLSLEVPLAVVSAAAAAARAPVVLNAAPAQDLPAALLADVDVLVVNEAEWDALGRKAAGAVVVTLGSRGCLVRQGTDEVHVPAVPVQAVDTTGAGDCFAAALSYGVAHGWPLTDAARFAGRAAALSVRVAGARAGLPTLAEVEAS